MAGNPHFLNRDEAAEAQHLVKHYHMHRQHIQKHLPAITADMQKHGWHPSDAEWLHKLTTHHETEPVYKQMLARAVDPQRPYGNIDNLRGLKRQQEYAADFVDRWKAGNAPWLNPQWPQDKPFFSRGLKWGFRRLRIAHH